VSDFGPRITIKIVDRLREDILAGKLKSGSEIKVLILSFCIYIYIV
jgi:fused signal recognition particle receptor